MPPTKLEARALPPLQSTVGPASPALLYAVDPGERKDCSVYDGQVLTQEKDFEVFLRTLPAGAVVVTETTAHLYKPARRDSLVSAARERGIQLLAARSVYTARRRGVSKKTDDNDALFIFWLYLERPDLFGEMKLSSEVVHLGTKNEPGSSRQRVNRKLILSRREGYANLEVPAFLVDTGLPNHGVASIAIYAAHAAEMGWGFRRLRRLAGDYAKGYPNIFRSNRNKHGIGKKFDTSGMRRKCTPEQKESMKLWTRLLKQALHYYRSQALYPLREPVVGPISPAKPRVCP
jgi:hypothetical protein